MSSNSLGSIIILIIGFILTLQVRDSASLSAVETHKEAIDSITKALVLYDTFKLWDTFDETVAKLDEYRGEFSKESADLIGEIKTYMLNGKDAYLRSTQSIYEWCGLTIPLLNAYNKLSTNLNQSKFTAQRALLLKVLDDGLKKMNQALVPLIESSTSFNDATGRLTSLVSDLQDTMEHIRTFYEETTETINKQITLIEEITGKLKDELRVIKDLTVQTEERKTFVEIDPELSEVVIESAHNLIAKCKEYRNKRLE